MDKYYVYGYFYGNTCFYIGMGQKTRYKIIDHIGSINPMLQNKKKMGI